MFFFTSNNMCDAMHFSIRFSNQKHCSRTTTNHQRNTVTKETFDANGLPTSDSASIKTAVYKVHVDKRRTSDSFAALIVLKDGSNTSQIVVKTP